LLRILDDDGDTALVLDAVASAGGNLNGVAPAIDIFVELVER